MCDRGSYLTLFINDYWGGRFWNIDQCIAQQIQMLLELKVRVIQACCGHGEWPIQILFEKGEANLALDIVSGLKPNALILPEATGTVLAQWQQLPEKEMSGWCGHAGENRREAGIEYMAMFINEGRHPAWWHNMPANFFLLIQMLRELGVHTTNSEHTAKPEEICLWFLGGKDNSAYQIVKSFTPDELTPPEHQGNHVAVWHTSPLPKLLAWQGDIRGYS